MTLFHWFRNSTIFVSYFLILLKQVNFSACRKLFHVSLTSLQFVRLGLSNSSKIFSKICGYPNLGYFTNISSIGIFSKFSILIVLFLRCCMDKMETGTNHQLVGRKISFWAIFKLILIRWQALRSCVIIVQFIISNYLSPKFPILLKKKTLGLLVLGPIFVKKTRKLSYFFFHL